MKKWLSLMGMTLGMLAVAGETKVDFGGDLRLRYVMEAGMPSGPHREVEYRDFTRTRTRLWGRIQNGDLTGYLRIGNESRYYFSPDRLKGRQRFPDVTFIDQLYLDVQDIFNDVDLRIGRQEMSYGKGRIISNGTGGDGSRSAYLDAIKLSFDFGNKRTLDAFGMYMARHDWMPTLGHRHDPRSADTKSYDYDITGNNHVEYGAGLYYQDRSCKTFGWDAYYLYKGEHGSKSTAIRRHPKLRGTNEDDFRWHTVGFRLLPQFSETLSGELETALQFGDEDMFAGMVYGGLTYAPELAYDPAFTFAVLYLSGDRNGTRGGHAWHALFNYNSYPGDTFCGLSNSDAATNVLYPHIEMTFKPAEYHSFGMMTGPVFLASDQPRATGGNYSDYCGYHAQLSYAWQIGKATQLRFGEDLTFSLFLDYLRKCASFDEDARGDALYAQAQLMWVF